MKNNKEQEIFPSIGFIPEMRYFATALVSAALNKQNVRNVPCIFLLEKNCCLKLILFSNFSMINF
jgi:hypothetical protein